MKPWTKGLPLPVFSCLLAACMAEIMAGASASGNILLRSAVTVPILCFFLWQDEALRRPPCGYGAWNERRLFAGIMAGAAASAGSFFIVKRAGLPGYAAVEEALFTGEFWLSCAVMVLAAPLSEELFFRGLLYRRLRDKLSFTVSAFCSAALFGLYHGNAAQGIYGFLAGLWLAFVMEQSQSMAAPFLVHMSANLTAILLRYLMVG